jgi:hypothetical protein
MLETTDEFGEIIFRCFAVPGLQFLQLPGPNQNLGWQINDPLEDSRIIPRER